VVASFGVGNATQINAVVGSIRASAGYMGFRFPLWGQLVVGIFLGVMLVILMRGGAKGIGSAAERLVPVASMGYLILCLLVLAICWNRIAGAFSLIFRGAFSPSAVTGGVVGSLITSVRVGTARGVFTNEAGMGTASIAHAGAEVDHPVEQGLMGIVEVFIDTIVICTMTALVILCSGISIPYGVDGGIALTGEAFSSVCGSWVSVPIALALCLFGIATVIGWGLYGIRCAQYLLGDGVWRGFIYLQGAMVVIGAVMGTGTVWLLAEIVNGLMAIPNLIALLVLSPELLRILKTYRA
jgi:AGCS family alanine or glycine:cation symporter